MQKYPLNRALSYFDVDRDGILSVDELANILANQGGSKAFPIADTLAIAKDLVFKYGDGNGVLTIAPFAARVQARLTRPHARAGALVLDMGTGETKLVLVMGTNVIELHTLITVKQSALETAQSIATRTPEGTAAFDAFVGPLLESLNAFLDSPLALEVNLIAALVGATAWIRLLAGADREAAVAFLGRLADVLTTPLSESGAKMRVKLLEGEEEA